MGKQEFGLPTDTIAAISTAPGRAGISVVRVSGPEAILVAASLGVTGLTPRRCVLTAVHHPEDGRLVDRAVVTLYRPVGYGGVGASPALLLLPDTHGIAFVAPPWICRGPTAGGSGTRNATRQGFSATSYTGEDVLEISGHGGALAPQLLLDGVCAAGARPAGPGEFARRAALFRLERGLSRRIEELREGLLRLQAMLTYEIDFRRRTTDRSRSDGFRGQPGG